MLFLGKTGTKICVNLDGKSRVERLQEKYVAYNADVCAGSYNLNLVVSAEIPISGHTEGGLIEISEVLLCFNSSFNLGNNLPSVGVFDAMLYGKLNTLGRFQVICIVSVSGCDNCAIE